MLIAQGEGPRRPEKERRQSNRDGKEMLKRKGSQGEPFPEDAQTWRFTAGCPPLRPADLPVGTAQSPAKKPGGWKCHLVRRPDDHQGIPKSCKT